MSTPIVVDEWLFHDLLGQNGDQKKEETFNFLNRLVKRCDKIVILKGSPFEEKIYNLTKESGRDPYLKGISQFFRTTIITNSQKTILVEEDAISPLPDYLMELVPRKDQYLFQAHLKVPNSFILTADGGWSPKLLKQKSIKVKMRDPFLKNYLKYSNL